MPPRFFSSFSCSRAKLDDFLLGQQFEIAVRFHLFDLAQTRDAALDGLEVREHAAEPALVDIVHVAALRFLLDGLLRLLLCADKKNRLIAFGDAAHEMISLFDLLYGFLQVDDVDAVAFRKDVFLHLRVPAAGLMAEMYAGLQQLLHGNHGHDK